MKNQENFPKREFTLIKGGLEHESNETTSTIKTDLLKVLPKEREEAIVQDEPREVFENAIEFFLENSNSKIRVGNNFFYRVSCSFDSDFLLSQNDKEMEIFLFKSLCLLNTRGLLMKRSEIVKTLEKLKIPSSEPINHEFVKKCMENFNKRNDIVPRSIVPRMICVHNEDNYLDPYIAICELSDFLEPKFARILRKYATSL